MLFISVLIFFIFSLDGILSQFEALFMIVSYFIYLSLVIWSERHLQKRKHKSTYFEKERLDAVSFKAIESPRKKSSTPRDIAIFLLGLAILLIAAESTLISAHDLSKEFYIAENVIGILIVGLGTSLPELVADLTAIRRGSFGIAVGDILGSNICDILLASGSGAIIINFNVPLIILVFDIPVLFLALSLAIYFLWTEKSLKRWEGGLLIGFYGVYAILKFLVFRN
jgi:cation:H+ antiporter